ncbi:hypothetical protein TNCV_1720711 [Trichonephila clavipes]|nr:hypothetical protein TNCV_1720711 [Trichonephila clavipes]
MIVCSREFTSQHTTWGRKLCLVGEYRDYSSRREVGDSDKGSDQINVGTCSTEHFIDAEYLIFLQPIPEFLLRIQPKRIITCGSCTKVPQPIFRFRCVTTSMLHLPIDRLNVTVA